MVAAIQTPRILKCWYSHRRIAPQLCAIRTRGGLMVSVNESIMDGKTQSTSFRG